MKIKKTIQGYTVEQEQIARFAKVLSHPIRIAILQLLRHETCCYHTDMVDMLPVAKSTLSQHLNELKNAGLIQGTMDQQFVKYCINKSNWIVAKKMIETLLTEIDGSVQVCSTAK